MFAQTVRGDLLSSITLLSVWTAGQTETVTWNASGIPAGVTGMIQLGYLDPNSAGEHLSTILASGFNLTDEKANIVVPSVVTRTTYILVLFGDSGNISPEFTIQGSSSSASGSGTASSPAASASTAPSVGSTSSPGSKLSVSPSPPIATGSFGFPLTSTATAPPSSAPTSSSSPSSPSSSLPTSASVSVTSGSPSGTSPSSPSPTPNTAWSTTFKTYQVMITPALALLLFI
ncbi:hypothetical protein K438DRAFT_186601 [Mycena galopus ATCC 62051]|nr:hypothetical protein K438DRAFT_186601 [Mycena galopus ATCC 62051]